MDDQDNTYHKLRQTPFEEVWRLYDDYADTVSKLSPVYAIGNTNVERRSFYPDIIRHNERIVFLRSHGWSIDDFCLALEKRAILIQIEIFNRDNVFPIEIIERAKTFWPNAKFIPASIELE
jgi:hypothetical protein